MDNRIAVLERFLYLGISKRESSSEKFWLTFVIDFLSG